MTEQHVEGVADLARDVHGVVGPADAAILRPYLYVWRMAAFCEDMHLYALVELVVEMSVYVHVTLNFEV